LIDYQAASRANEIVPKWDETCVDCEKSIDVYCFGPEENLAAIPASYLPDSLWALPSSLIGFADTYQILVGNDAIGV
jgi:hypothetical protein